MKPIELMQLSADDRMKEIRRQIAENEFGKTRAEIEAEDAPYDYRSDDPKSVLHLHLTESQITLIYDLLDSKELMVNALIEKCRYISKKDKYKEMLYDIEQIRNAITDQ